ncbi:MAG: hypothetical protein JNM83_05090 [Myxococcales bacterium]|jgi:hypothetical protein|nr:hypothetical protein [Myxococcales bacterium]
MKRALLALAFCGCVNDDIVLYETRVRGTVTAMAAGTLHLEFHHETSFGQRALAHPLGLFERRVRTVSQSPYSLDETVLYPQQKGDGLVIYGWLDIDGDGVLCAPGKTPEPAGLFRTVGFPSHNVNISLLLDRQCLGSESPGF